MIPGTRTRRGPGLPANLTKVCNQLVADIRAPKDFVRFGSFCDISTVLGDVCSRGNSKHRENHLGSHNLHHSGGNPA